MENGLVIGGLTVSRHAMNGDEVLYYPAASINHPNYLQLLYFDGQRHMIHHRYDMTLQQHLDHLDQLGTQPLLHYQFPVDDSLPVVQRITYICASAPYKTMMKALLQFVFDMHAKKRLCLTQFGIGNIVVANGVLKYVGVGFVPATPESMRNDYACVMGIISIMFRGNLPSAVRCLYDAALNLPYTSELDGFLLVNHLAVMSPVQILLFVVALYERGKFEYFWLEEDDDTRLYYESALGDTNRIGDDYFRDLDVITVPDCENWDRWFKKLRGFEHISSWAQSKECRFDQYCTVGSPHELRMHIIWFCRNIAFHLKDYLCKYPTGVARRYTEEDCAMIIMQIFGKVLCPLQYRLYRFGYLQDFLRD